jgi:hypothetical protein
MESKLRIRFGTRRTLLGSKMRPEGVRNEETRRIYRYGVSITNGDKVRGGKRSGTRYVTIVVGHVG